MIALTLATSLCMSAAVAARAAGPNLKVRTSEAIVATWKCQDQRGVARTAARSPWKPHSQSFRRAQLNLWTKRLAECRRLLHAHDDMIRRLQRGLAGTPMAGSEHELEAAGRAYHIHPAFIAAIAGTESSFGHAACRSNRFNAFGLSSCGTGWTVPNFQSWSDAYVFMAQFLTGHTRVTSGWPNARTTYDYKGYAANHRSWGAKCAYWMRARFGVGSGVRYA